MSNRLNWQWAQPPIGHQSKSRRRPHSVECIKRLTSRRVSGSDSDPVFKVIDGIQRRRSQTSVNWSFENITISSDDSEDSQPSPPNISISTPEDTSSTSPPNRRALNRIDPNVVSKDSPQPSAKKKPKVVFKSQPKSTPKSGPRDRPIVKTPFYRKSWTPRDADVDQMSRRSGYEPSIDSIESIDELVSNQMELPSKSSLLQSDETIETDFGPTDEDYNESDNERNGNVVGESDIDGDEDQITAETDRNLTANQINIGRSLVTIAEESDPLTVAERVATNPSEVNPNVSPIKGKGLRRSQRPRRPPLESWKGERYVYKRDSTGLTEKVVDIDPGIQYVPKERKPKKKNLDSKKAIKRADVFNLSIHNKQVKDECDKRSKKSSTIRSLRNMGWRRSKIDDGFSIGIISKDKSRGDGIGKLRFKGHAKKSRTQTGDYTTHLTVIFGALHCTLEDKEPVIVRSGDTITVKPYATYELVNLRSDTAYLSFTVLKA